MKTRIYKWDNLKFILITLVVIGHFIDKFSANSDMAKSMWIFITLFHMPVFIFVSGLFAKKSINQEKLCIDKIFAYLFLAFLLKMFLYLVSTIFGDPSFKLLEEGGIPWYLIVMAVFMFITHFLKNIKWQYVVTFSILIALFAGYDNSIGDKFCLSRIIVFYPFFLAGYYINRDKILNILENKKVKIVSIFVLVLFVVLCTFGLDYIYPYRRLLTSRNPYDVVLIENCWFIYRLIAYLMTVTIGIAVMSLVPNKNIKGITINGQRTLQVYFMHNIIIMIIMGVGVFNVLNKYCSYNTQTIIAVILSIIISFVLSAKIFEKPFKKIMDCKR